MSKRSRAYLRHQNERWKKRVKGYYITEAMMWPQKEPPPSVLGKVSSARAQWDTEPWGAEGTRAVEKERAKKEINEQLEGE